MSEVAYYSLVETSIHYSDYKEGHLINFERFLKNILKQIGETA